MSLAKFHPTHPDAKHPTVGSPGSVGYDLYTIEGGTVPPGGSAVFRTGISVEMPEDFYFHIASRSGMGFRGDIEAFPGKVDQDYYPNEIKVKLFNRGRNPLEVFPGAKIAQGIFDRRYMIAKVVLENEERTGGFGSTGS